jgi:hypothetical protein
MSKEQWGHGFHKGVEAASKNQGTLVGLWFHSYKDGEVHWQGHVARALENGSYVVQLFDWIAGEPSDMKVVEFGQMQQWNFYPSAQDMRNGWARIRKQTVL